MKIEVTFEQKLRLIDAVDAQIGEVIALRDKTDNARIVGVLVTELDEWRALYRAVQNAEVTK